jgi:hypothetical protein
MPEPPLTIAPSQAQVQRATPEVWIYQGARAEGFFKYMGVEPSYRDPVATMEHHSQVFFDGWSQICLSATGDFIATNSAKGYETPAIQVHVQRIREQIAQGEYVDVSDAKPKVVVSTSRCLNYYHFLFDDLARLGFYESLPNFAETQLIVTSPRRWQQEVYHRAGVAGRLRVLSSKLHRLHNVWLAPRGLASIANIRTRGFDWIARLSASTIPSRSPRTDRRIFVSRETTRHRRLINEHAVQEFASAEGFDVVRPEELSFLDQLELFGQCQMVLGVFGAGLTNAAFMRPGTALLEIAPPKSSMATAHNAIFSTVSGLKGLRYGLVVGDDIDFNPQTHDFPLPLDWLAALLSEGPW